MERPRLALADRRNDSRRYFPGGSPGAGHLLLRGQKKVTEEKAAPVSRHSRGAPVLLDEPGGCGTRSRNERTHRTCESSDSPRRIPRPACVTRRLTGGAARVARMNDMKAGDRLCGRGNPECAALLPGYVLFQDTARRWTPCEPPSSRRQGRGFRRGLSERSLV